MEDCMYPVSSHWPLSHQPCGRATINGRKFCKYHEHEIQLHGVHWMQKGIDAFFGKRQIAIDEVTNA
jgi:hypothetical protein